MLDFLHFGPLKTYLTNSPKNYPAMLEAAVDGPISKERDPICYSVSRLYSWSVNVA